MLFEHRLWSNLGVIKSDFSPLHFEGPNGQKKLINLIPKIQILTIFESNNDFGENSILSLFWNRFWFLGINRVSIKWIINDFWTFNSPIVLVLYFKLSVKFYYRFVRHNSKSSTLLLLLFPFLKNLLVIKYLHRNEWTILEWKKYTKTKRIIHTTITKKIFLNPISLRENCNFNLEGAGSD